MKKFKIKYLKKFICFILIFSLLFAQNGVLIFADVLNNGNNLTSGKSLDKDTKDETKNAEINSNKNGDIEAHGNYTINNKDIIKPIRDAKKNTLKSSDSGELVSIGNLGLGERILPNKLPKLVKGQLPFPDYSGGYYYNQLNLDKKIAYQVYLWLIENVAPMTYIDISALGLEMNDFYAIHQVVLMENPEIFHARGIVFSLNNNKKVSHIYYQSIFKLEEIKRMKKKVDDAYKLVVLNIKSSLKDNYTRLDVVRAIHDYVGQTAYGAICEASVHPTPDHFNCPEFYKQHSIYGVFVERRAICEGLSYAVMKLAKEFGIPVLADAGYPKVLNIPSHIWNLIQMDDGKWYVDDATADGKSYHDGENKFDNFLIGENSNKIQHEHDPYLLGYNSKFKAQVYNIPELSQENYIKINVKYPSNRVEFYRTFKDALEDIKRNNLPGNHKILLTDDYSLTSEEVELFKGFESEKNISFEFSSIKDIWMLRKYSLGAEGGNLYLPKDTNFSNINYDIQNLYTQGNKVSFYGEITNIFGKLSDIYLGQKDGKVSELQIENGSFNKIYLAKDYKGFTNNIYSNDINFRMSNGSIKELYISDKDTITGNININISKLASINSIYYGENITLDNSKKLAININGGAITQIVPNEKPIDANVDINFSGGRIGNMVGPTVKSETNSIKTTNIRVSGGEILSGVYGDVGYTSQHPNNNIFIDLKGISIPNVDVARATTGKGTVKVSGTTSIGNLINFDEVNVLKNTYLKVNEEISYSKNNNRLGKIKYSESNSQIQLPPKHTQINQFEDIGNNNALIISNNNAYISLLESPILNNKFILKYADGVKAKKDDKIIEFPSGYKVDLNKFENQIDSAYPLEIDASKRFIKLGNQKSVSYIDTMEGRYPYEGDWGKEHVVTSPNTKNGTSSSNILKSDEITLQEGKLPYKDFEGDYYYKQLTELNKKIAYQLYYYIANNLEPDEYLDISKLKLEQNDFYGTFDIVFHENPKIFWARDIVMEIDGQTNKVNKIKYYTPFTKEELAKMKVEFNKGIEKAIAEINSKLTEKSSKFEKVKAIHDYLIKNNHYGSETCPETEHPGTGHLGCKGQYIEHSAYGAFVKTLKYGVVCEGFGTAFILLSKHFGIEAIFDAGTSKKAGGGFHLWNYVKMDDEKWYLLDLTFDNGYLGEDKIAYNLFLAGKNDPAFNYKHDKYLSGIWNDLSKAQVYNIPDISNTSYIKFEVIYPDKSRNVFRTFNDLLEDLKTKTIEGKYTILLRDDYSLTKQEVQKLKEYKAKPNQSFGIQSLDEDYMSKPYSLKSETNKIYFPMEVSISNISYDIANTYSEGKKITIGESVEKSNTSNANNIYLMAKQELDSINEISIKSGSWEKIVGSYSENKTDSSHNGTTNISISDGNIKEVILSQAGNVKGNINVNISDKADIENFKYGENINLDKGKSININISGGKIQYFEANDKAIFANTNINVTGGEVEGLMGPVAFSKNNKNTTNINVTNGTVGTIVGGGTYENNIENNNDVVIDIKNIKNINSITGLLYGKGNATIKVNSDITTGRVTDFDKLIIGQGNSLEITQDLNYNQMKTIRKGIVEFSGDSKLILPEVPSTVGSLKSIGTLNKLIVSKEEAYLNINEKQEAQGSSIGINYKKGLLPQNGDEILRYKNKEDINLNNFINEVDEKFVLYNDKETGSIRLNLDKYPLRVSYKDGDIFKFTSLAEALEGIENVQDESASEVTFSIYGEYEMTDEDLVKLESYSSTVNNQKFIFTSGEETAVLSTIDDVIFPVNDKLGEIEFKKITLDFDNKNIFASGSHLIMDESVKMTNKSNVDLYGGLFKTEVTNSKLTLNGGTFNNVYGGGSSLEGIVSNDINITLGKNVLVKGNVYGGADSDRTGSKESKGTTTINLIGGTVKGDIIGGGKNNQSPVFNKIIINYGDTARESITNVKNIYGLAKTLIKGTEDKSVDININKNAEFEILAGFSNVNVNDKVTLKVLKVLKYDAGISNSSEGKVKLSGGSDFYIPNAADEENRKIGKLETIGLNNIHIDKNKYLLIDGKINPIIGKLANISYYNGSPELNDSVVKFSNKTLTNNEHFKTNYNFNISTNLESGLLYLSKEPYEVRLYTDNNTLYKTDKANENSQYTFEQGLKIPGKKFIKWKNRYEENVYYTVGQTVNLDNNISVIGVYEDIEEYTVTLKIDGVPYKTDYVEAGHSYTFTMAPPNPGKYFIGWTESNNVLPKLSTAMGKTLLHIQPGTTIIVNSNLIYNADYGKEVKYEVDYGDENGKVEDSYYEGGSLNVPSNPPINIKVPVGKVWGGFKAIFGGIGSIIGSIFKPGSSVIIQPGIKLEAVWVDELTIKLDDENGNNIETEKIGKGFEYTFPNAPEIEDKEFLYWQDKSNISNKYHAGQKIEVNSNMELKAVYKNIKVISIALDNLKEEKFTDLSSALNYAKNKEFKTINIKLLENYSLRDVDIKELKDFNKNDVSFVIKGLNKETELAIDSSIMLSTDTKFENIVLDYKPDLSYPIYARGHKLEMGENVTMKSTGCPILIGGENGRNVSKSEIIVRSGRYKDIYGGGYLDNSGVNGNINIELHGGEIIGNIYGGSKGRGRISGGETTIKLIGGSVAGLVSGTSRVSGLESSNDVNIHLLGTEFKKGNVEVYGGFATLSEDGNHTGESTIYVEKPWYTVTKLVGFRKLDIKQGMDLTVTNVLNHKGGINVTENSGELSLNGNSKLTIPSTSNVADRQAGWISSKGDNNKIIVNKDNYLSLTSTKEDVIDKPVVIDFKNPETDKTKSTLLKYETNKSKANRVNFVKGENLPSEVFLKDDKTDGTVYMEEEDLLTVTKPNGESLKFRTFKDGIKKIKADTQTGTYTITLDKNYSLTNEDVDELEYFNKNDVSFVIKGLNKETELAIDSSIMLSTDTKFENIVLDYKPDLSYPIYARGHKLEMGENVTMKSTGCPILIGGDNRTNVNKSEIIVRSGRYKDIYGGGYLDNSGVNGNINIELHGGEIIGNIYGGSKGRGKISGGKTTIKLIGGSVAGLVSGTSRVSGLESSNDVNIHLLGTEFKKGNVEVYGGFATLSEDGNHTGESTIYVEKPWYTVTKLVGFRKLDIKQGMDLTVTNVLNHKGGINVTENSGELSLNGNSKLTIPSTSNVADRQAGWISSKGDNNKIIVNKDNYLSLTSTKEDVIDKPVVIDFKNPETDKTKSTLLKYETNKSKANRVNFVKGENLPSEVFLKDDKTDGTVYMEEEDLLTVTKPNGESLKFRTFKDGIKKIKADTQTGTYTITLDKNYSLTNEDVDELEYFNKNDVSFVIKGLNKETELAIDSSIMLSTDTKFENIVLDYKPDLSYPIYARGHKLEMGENVTMKSTGCPILIGGDNRTNVNKSEIIVRSGRYKDIYGGGYLDNSGVNGNINIELHGGEIIGNIYGGSKGRGKISGGKTTIKLIGGSVAGLVSGTSRVSGLESSNDVNIHLLGTEFKKGNVEVYGGFATLSEDVNHTGESTIYVEKPWYTVTKLVGFRKLDIKQGMDLTVTNVLNHKGGIKVTENSGELSLNGNSKLTIPSTSNVIDRQAGWISSKGDNNKIIVNKDNYLSLTSTKEDEISNSVLIDLKKPEKYEIELKSTLLKYETNKQKANASKFFKGKNLPSEVILKENKTDGTVYMKGDYSLIVTKPNGDYLSFKTIKDSIKKIKEDTQIGIYTITLHENYSLTNEDIEELEYFDKNDVSFVIKGLNKETELAIDSSIMLSTDTKFENIVLNYKPDLSYPIYARGHRLEMGENVTMKSTGCPILIGGENGRNVSKSEIIVRSGRYKDIYGGGYLGNSGVNGNINIELHGGEIIGNIYGGSKGRGRISGGKTTIKLIGGSVAGLVSGTSRVSGLESSNDVNIHLLGTEFKKGNVEVYGGFATLSEDVNHTGESTIYVEKPWYTVTKLVGFRKLDIKQGMDLTVTNVLNHKGGIKVTENSGELSLNGNSKLTIPSTSNVINRQAGWISSKGDNNKIIVNKDNYLSLTSTKEDVIDKPVVIDLKNPETDKIKSTLLKYETNKQKANTRNFVKGKNLPSKVILKDNKPDGTVYMEEEDLLTVTKPNGEYLKFITIKDGIKKIKEDTQTGTYTITLDKNYSLTNSDIDELKDFNKNNVNFVIKGLNKETELAIDSSIMLSTDTKFENIVLDYGTSTSYGIYARGHKLEMGKNVTMKSTGCPILIGGENGRDVSKSEIIVRSGRYKDIYGGGYLGNSGVNGNINIELHGGEIIGNIYGGSHDKGRISDGETTIKLIGGSVAGLVSGTSRVSGLESSNDVNIHLLGTEFKKGNVEVYGGFATLNEDVNHTGESTIYVEKPWYTVTKLVGFRKLDIKQGMDLTVTNVLNHKGGIKVTENSGELSLNGNAKIKIPSSWYASDRQVGWIRSGRTGNSIIFSSMDDYLNLTSTRSNMHQDLYGGVGCPVELNFDYMIDNLEKTYLIRYENNKKALDANNFIVGRNLGKYSILGIEEDKLYSVKEPNYLPEESYMMIVKHSRKILGVQNSNRRAHVLQLTHPYGQYYGPYEDYSYWRFEKLPNGNYKIVNNKSNLVLTVKDGSLENEAFIIQEKYVNDLSQQWIVDIESSEKVIFNGSIESTAFNVAIKNAKSGKVIDLREASYSDGAPFIQYDNSNGENQKFLLVKHIGRPLEQ